MTGETADSAPTIRFVNSLIERAFHERASDIHLEPQEGEMVVRMRIDGLLRRILTVPADLQNTVISRLKIMGGMNIAEHKIPQDGHAMLRVKGSEIDLRISSMPTVYGEKIVKVQELAIKNTDKVLEIGTGSGYMAALLAAKAEFVYSVEIVPELVEFARANLKRAGVANVSVDLGDGAHGWPLYAPYDVIVLSGSTPVLPEAIQQQLRIGGRLVAIVGEAPAMQVKLVTRTGEDAYTAITVFETVAAPLVNAQARSAFVF